MRWILLGLGSAVALSAIAATPAAAQRWSDPGFGAAANVKVHHGKPREWTSASRERSHGRRHGRHRDRDGGYPIFGAGWGYDAEINESWEPDSYNDWWHDRPDRSLPRWVRYNGSCERVYWSGGGWRC